MNQDQGVLKFWSADYTLIDTLTVTCRLWLPGDENRLLPMPLRYAATHPQSPQAIVGVLNGGK